MFLRGQVLECIIAALPYADQAEDWNLDDHADGSRISFTWRDTRYCVEFKGGLSVWTTNGHTMAYDDRAIMMERAIMRAWADRLVRFNPAGKAPAP